MAKRSCKIGYGKSPVKTRWKSGPSGNSKGRPRGARNRLSALMPSVKRRIVYPVSVAFVPAGLVSMIIPFSMAAAAVVFALGSLA